MNPGKAKLLSHHFKAFNHIFSYLEDDVSEYHRELIANTPLIQEGLIYINFELGHEHLKAAHQLNPHVFFQYAHEAGRIYRLKEADNIKRSKIALDAVVSMMATFVLLELHARTLAAPMTDTLTSTVCREHFAVTQSLTAPQRKAVQKAVNDHVEGMSYSGRYIARTTRILHYVNR